MFVDCLFPVYCVQCGAEGAWWCSICQESEKRNLHFLATPPPLNGLMAIFSYHSESPVGELIKQFKYNFGLSIAELWEEILPIELPIDAATATIIPVPLYARRERERGYNQAHVIARLLAKKIELPFEPEILVRWRPTRQQARLSGPERRENVRDAFKVRQRAPEIVILVDDVFTTGATMSECASALKAAGTRQVFGFVLAKGET